jgi:hypothetical protein
MSMYCPFHLSPLHEYILVDFLVSLTHLKIYLHFLIQDYKRLFLYFEKLVLDLISSFQYFYSPIFYVKMNDSISTNVINPAANPINANQPIFFRYQKNSIFSIPIATTPAADPIINTLPPVPAE